MARKRRVNMMAFALIIVIVIFVLAVVYASRFIVSQPPPEAQINQTNDSGNSGGISNSSGNSTATFNASASNSTSGGTGGSGEAGSVNGTIRIAAFNIQVFGESKRSKPEVMAVLAKTARQFDVMAVEELRDDTETTLPAYLEAINALPGPSYAAVSSPRLGRTSSKENYAFVYNTQKIRLVAGSNYTFEDPPSAGVTGGGSDGLGTLGQNATPDLFQREPFIARFEAVSANGSAFDFALIVIHTDPDTTPQELSDLPLALADARSRYVNETDYVLLGDMNADCSYLSQSEASALALRNASFTWVVPESADTTVKSSDCAYDRIILAGTAASGYTGNWGIFRFDQEYGLNQSMAESVSDHYPVWADFGH